MEVVKMSVGDQATVRADLYEAATKAVLEMGYQTETVSDGMLVHLGEEQYALINVSVKDPTKFNLQTARELYAEKQRKHAERQEAKAAREAKRAEDAAKKAEAAKKKAEAVEEK